MATVAASASAQTVLKLQTSSAAGSFSINYMNENWVLEAGADDLWQPEG
jgi:hypothetical protein